MNNDILNTPIEFLKGVGPNRAKLIKNELKISNFKDISYQCNSLIVLDVDNTIFYYPNLDQKWWINSINDKMLHKKLSFNDADREFLQRIAHETIEDFYNIKL